MTGLRSFLTAKIHILLNIPQISYAEMRKRTVNEEKRYVERIPCDTLLSASGDLGIVHSFPQEYQANQCAYSLCTEEVRGVKTFAPINVIVHYPKTEEGMRELRRRVASVRADMVLNSISKLDCPTSQKERLLDAIIRDTKNQIQTEQQQTTK